MGNKVMDDTVVAEWIESLRVKIGDILVMVERNDF
jgi:hypothetical protein